MTSGGQPLQSQAQNHQVALRALLAGGLLVQAAEAHGAAGSDETFGAVWPSAGGDRGNLGCEDGLYYSALLPLSIASAIQQVA